jgi:capsular exopolysaccharide synthesis family protein
MGKIHEALSRAEKDSGKNYLLPVRRKTNEMLPALPSDATVQPVPKWYKELRIKIKGLSENHRAAVIMFTGASSKAGCTTTISEFALSLARSFRNKVMMIDINLQNPVLHKFISQNCLNLHELITEQGQIDENLVKNMRENLHLLTSKDESADDVTRFLASGNFKQILDEMRDKFDFILIDAPPVTQFSEAGLVARLVDGAVIVVAAGETRKKVAMKVKKELQSLGVEILGAVLNRRKFYIPKWIYKRL